MLSNPLTIVAIIASYYSSTTFASSAQAPEPRSADICGGGIYGELAPILKDYPVAQAFCTAVYPVKCTTPIVKRLALSSKRAVTTTTKPKSTTTTAKSTTKSTTTLDIKASAWSKCQTQGGNVVSTMCSCIEGPPRSCSVTKITTTSTGKTPSTTTAKVPTTTTTTSNTSTTRTTTTKTTTTRTTTSPVSTTSSTRTASTISTSTGTTSTTVSSSSTSNKTSGSSGTTTSRTTTTTTTSTSSISTSASSSTTSRTSSITTSISTTISSSTSSTTSPITTTTSTSTISDVTTTTSTTSSTSAVHTVDAPQCNPADNGDTGDCIDFCTCLTDNNGVVAYCGALPEEPSCDVDEDCAQGSFCAANLAQCVQGTQPERCTSTYVSGTKRSLFDAPMGRMSRRRST